MLMAFTRRALPLSRQLLSACFTSSKPVLQARLQSGAATRLTTRPQWSQPAACSFLTAQRRRRLPQSHLLHGVRHRELSQPHRSLRCCSTRADAAPAGAAWDETWRSLVETLCNKVRHFCARSAPSHVSCMLELVWEMLTETFMLCRDMRVQRATLRCTGSGAP